MKIERFEDIDAWKEARLLVREVYKLLSAAKDYGFKDQIQRAALSVMSNIAEGFDRGSNKEFIQFLIVARGSLAEVKSLSYAGVDLAYLKEKDFELLSTRCMTASNLINGFIRYLKTSKRER